MPTPPLVRKASESQRPVARRAGAFVATLALGECEETRALRAFRDLYLSRSSTGRWLAGSYYEISPRRCNWLETKPNVLGVVKPILKALGRVAIAAVKMKLG